MSNTREQAQKVVQRVEHRLGEEFVMAARHELCDAIDETLRNERERCAKITQAWLWGSLTDPDALESVGKYAARRCQGILNAINSGETADHLARGQATAIRNDKGE